MLARLTAVSLLAVVTVCGSPVSLASTEPAPASSAAAEAGITPLAHVEARGEGPVPMVLIPGVGFDWTVFGEFMSRNDKRYTMYAVTLPGFGGSEAPPLKADQHWRDGAWLNNAAAAVLAMMRERGIEKPVIVGHSLGGHLAMKLALEHPDAVRSAVSIDGFPALPMSEEGKTITREDRLLLLEQFLEPSFEKMDLGEQQRSLLPSMVRSPERAAALAKISATSKTPTLVRYTLEGAASDLTEALRENTTPILVMAAVPDAAVVPEEASREGMRSRWRELVKDAKATTLVFFENSRHFIMDDAPAELDAAVEGFVAGKAVEGKK